MNDAKKNIEPTFLNRGSGFFIVNMGEEKDVEIIIVFCLLIIIFLLWSNGTIISSNSSDWLILVWEKNIRDEKSGRKTFEYHDGISINQPNIDKLQPLNIRFIPIIGWRYNHWPHKSGYLTPITPPIYRVKDTINKSDNGYLKYLYWIRDGKEYNISSNWTTRNDFWSNLSEVVLSGTEIKFQSKIPDSLRTKLTKYLNEK